MLPPEPGEKGIKACRMQRENHAQPEVWRRRDFIRLGCRESSEKTAARLNRMDLCAAIGVTQHIAV